MASQQASIAKIPTARQQRLRWEPAKQMAYRELGQFRALFNVYQFATGKRYARSDKGRAAIKFICRACKRGCCSLRQYRTSAVSSWWGVRTVVTCDCGEPPALLEDLKSNDLTVLTNRYVPQKADWELLACACFPRGFIRVRQSSRRWFISCRGKDCKGGLDIELVYLPDGRKYDAFRILSVVECSRQCKEVGGQGSVIPVRAPQENDDVCPLCCQTEPHEYVKFPCGQRTCKGCFEKLVQSCPAEISKRPNLAIFQPGRNPAHRHSCPFCKAAYCSQTRVQYWVRGSSNTAHDVEVHELVTIPFAYQSFDPGVPGHIATEADYHAMQIRYDAYLRQVEAERLRESQMEAQRGATTLTSDELVGLLNAVTWEDFERLQTLCQAGRFRRHRHLVLNFMDAVEFLHDKGLDGGFLQRIADENDGIRRSGLMQDAYEIGWNGQDSINPQLIINLLQRKQLVEVIDLVSDSDSDSDSDDNDDI